MSKDDNINQPDFDTGKFHLFKPRSKRDLEREYPELSEVDEFNKLSSSDLVFVWYLYNRTSPLYHDVDIRRRVGNAINFSYSITKLSVKLRNEYLVGKFPEKIKIAGQIMSNYDPHARIRAKLMMEKIMLQYEETVSLDKSHFIDEDGMLDMARKNSHINSCAKIADSLPKMITLLETGFGIVETDQEDTRDSLDAMNAFHSNNNE